VYLQPFSIPTSDTTTDDATERVERVLHASAAFLGLSVICSLLLGRFPPLISAVLKESWPTHVWPWCQYLHTKVVEDKSLSAEERRLGLSTVVHVTYSFAFDPPVREAVARTPGLHYLLARLWYLEGKDPQLHPSAVPLSLGMSPRAGQLFLAPRPVCEYILEIESQSAFGLTWAIDFEAAADGKPAQVASAALAHLRRDISQPQLETLKAWNDVQAIAVLCGYQPFQNCLLSQQSVRAATLALVRMVSGPVPKTKDGSQCDAVTYLCFYLQRCFAAPGAHVWVLRSLEAGLLPALLRCDGWSKQLKMTYQADILGKFLPKYVVYVSVMRAITESMKKINEQKLEAILVKGGPLEKEWKTLKQRISERQASFGSVLQNLEQCHNSKVWSSFESLSRFYVLNYCADSATEPIPRSPNGVANVSVYHTVLRNVRR
jgi:hypothetical protein